MVLFKTETNRFMLLLFFFWHLPGLRLKGMFNLLLVQKTSISLLDFLDCKSNFCCVNVYVFCPVQIRHVCFLKKLCQIEFDGLQSFKVTGLEKPVLLYFIFTGESHQISCQLGPKKLICKNIAKTKQNN